MAISELLKEPAWQVSAYIISGLALGLGIYVARTRLLLGVASFVLIFLVVAATIFVAKELIPTTSQSTEWTVGLVGVAVGIMVTLVISYLYNSRELKRKKSSMNKLREQEKEFFDSIENHLRSKGAQE